MSFPNAERLTFRAWQPTDVESMFKLTSNEQTQRFFPKPHTVEMAQDLFNRMVAHFDEHGFTYYPVFEKESEQFIGFIGCAWQKEIHELCPLVDIGWRLLPEYWGKGYATEGAIACMHHIFEKTNIEDVYAMAPKVNRPSIAVMKKLGMQFLEFFNHPKLKESPDLENCELHKISRSEWKARAQS